MVGFEAGKDRLRALVEREAVGLEAWKARLRDSLHEDLHDPLRSRARFRQRIEFGSGFVDRPSLFIRLDEWRRTWRTTPAPIVLVGDEGDGKTWLACSWVDQRACADSSFPAVLVVNSAALDDKPLMDVIVDAATTQPTALPEYGQPTRDRVRRRVARWTSAARTTPADQPPILLLLDGLDEGASPRTLRALIDRSRVDLPRVPLLMTVRAKFWDEHFRPDRDLSVHELTVGPFDDDEFERALVARGIDPAHLSTELLHLLRKPRYLDLAASLQDRVMASRDLTVARLRYEDWKDRYGRKPGSLVSDKAFQRLLVRLARIARTKGGGTGRTEIMEVLAGERSDQAINDLCTSGVLDQDDEGRFTVSQARLPLAMGLLLASEVRRSCKEGTDPYEMATRWLEPEDGQGITAGAAESAALAALFDPGFPVKGASVLLRTWLDRQQRAHRARKAFIAYVRARPEAYCELAETVWEPSQEDRHEREALVMAALLEGRNYADVLDAVRPYCDRWLSFVPDPAGMAFTAPKEDREAELERIRALLGFVSPAGVATVCRRELIVVRQELMRLARVALAIISHVTRGPHIRAIANALLVDVITRVPGRQHAIQWILRTSPDNVEATVLSEADDLLGSGIEEARRTAIRLLYGLGTRRSEDRAQSATVEQTARRSYGFPWNEDEYLSELAKESRLSVVARGMSKVGLNPTIAIPTVGFEPLVEGLDPRSMWHGASATFEEHMLEEYEVVFARTDPLPLVTFYRKAAETARGRGDEELLSLCWALRPNMLLLDEPACEELYAAWSHRFEPYDERRRHAERTLLLLILQAYAGQAQLNLLLQRPPDAPDYNSFAELFRGEPDWIAVLRVLQSGTPRDVGRVGWHLSCLRRRSPPEVATLLAQRSGDSDRYVRLATLWWAVSQADSVRELALAKWTPPPDAEPAERNAAGLLFASCRTDPRHVLGLDHISSALAVRERGCAPDDLEWYGQQISGAVAKAGMATRWPTARVALAKAREADGWPGSEGLTLVVRGDEIIFTETWGGLPHASAADFRRIFDSAARSSAANAELRSADMRLGAERAAGNSLYYEVPHVEVLSALDCIRPEQVAAWVALGLASRGEVTPSVLDSLGGLYQSLCIVGFRNGRGWAVDLCRALAQIEPQWIEASTGTPWSTLAAWEAGPPVDGIDGYREELLRNALSDLALCELAVAAKRSGLGPTLLRLLEKLTSDGERLIRARGVAALGFITDPAADDLLASIRARSPDPWLDEVAGTAVERRRVDAWARHWFDRFLSAPRDEDAWGGFRLFLRCVDMRFVVWRQSRRDAIDKLSDRRRAFFLANVNAIDEAIKKRGADAKKTLAGHPVLDREAWPWMEDVTVSG